MEIKNMMLLPKYFQTNCTNSNLVSRNFTEFYCNISFESSELLCKKYIDIQGHKKGNLCHKRWDIL